MRIAGERRARLVLTVHIVGLTYTTYLLSVYRYLADSTGAHGEREGSAVVGRGGDEGKVEALGRTCGRRRIAQLSERCEKPVRGFRTAETTAARHVVAATLTNSSAFVAGHRLIWRPNTTASRARVGSKSQCLRQVKSNLIFFAIDRKSS